MILQRKCLLVTQICVVQNKFKLPISPDPQSLGLWFSECQCKCSIGDGHYEKIEKWPPFRKYASYGKISDY